MAVQCGLAASRRNRWLIYIVLCGAFAGWHVYDGWFNEKYRAEDKKSDLKYNQGMSVILSGLTSALVLGLVVLSNKSLVADQEGIRRGSKTVAWKDFTEADRKNLTKGILVLYHKSDQGQEEAQKLVLDNYKLSNFDDLLDEIATHRPDLVPPAEGEGEEPM